MILVVLREAVKMDRQTLACIFTVACAFGAASMTHIVPEGFIGFYYRFGRLLDGNADPGIHFKMPFVTSVETVQITEQTDKVTDIYCGTSGGTMVKFESIEVVNQLERDFAWEVVRNYTVDYDKPLIFHKLHHEVNQICSDWTLDEVYTTRFSELDEMLMQRVGGKGVIIKKIRLSKPKLPKELVARYETLEKEKAELAVAIEHQRLVERTSETERKRALIEAQRVADVETIGMQTRIAQQETERKIATISNTMLVEKATASADAEFTRLRAIAEMMNTSEGRASLQHHLAEEHVAQTRDAMRHARMIIVPDKPTDGMHSLSSALALAAFTQQAIAIP